MPNEGQILMSVDRLMLDAKKAILEEQHRRLQILRQEERWADLLQQLPATLSCAADVLQHSLDMLQTMAGEGQLADRFDPSVPPE